MAELRTRSSERLTPKITLVLQPNHHADHAGEGPWAPTPQPGTPCSPVAFVVDTTHKYK